MDHLNFECLVKAKGILKMYVKFKNKTKMLYHLQRVAEVEISSDVRSFFDISDLYNYIYIRNVEAFLNHNKESLP